MTVKKTWYYAEGSKRAEIWTILHLPYTLMALSFLMIGFAISKPVNYTVMAGAVVAYFMGLGIAAHALDQLPGQGSSYVRYLTPGELLLMGVTGLSVSVVLGVIFMIKWSAWHMLWLMPLQGFFAVAYPVSKLFRGFFHTDYWFSVGFGFIPVIVGYYANTLSFSLIVIPWALVCMTVSRIEILLSRYSRKLRAENADNKFLDKPEMALKLLCVLSYLIAIAVYVI